MFLRDHREKNPTATEIINGRFIESDNIQGDFSYIVKVQTSDVQSYCGVEFVLTCNAQSC